MARHDTRRPLRLDHTVLMPHAAPDSDEVARCYVCHRAPEKDLTPLTPTDSGGSRPEHTFAALDAAAFRRLPLRCGARSLVA